MMRRDGPLASLLVTAGLLAAATAAGMLLRAAGLQEATVVVTYVLAVIGVALATPGGPWCLIAAALSVLSFNFFFAAPTLSLAALDPAMPGTFAVMFVWRSSRATLPPACASRRARRRPPAPARRRCST